jgi:hypothetical protein
MQRWIWRQLRVELPEDWELLQFMRNPESGRCAFADRYQFRFELSWRRVPGPPDLERMLTDYRSRLEEDGLGDTRRIQSAAWQGVSGVLSDQRTSCRYGGHFAPLGCLVEAVFLWPKDRHEPTERAVLESLGPEVPNAAGQVRWQAFGLDLLTGADGVLERCRADPGMHELRFGANRRRLRQRFSRRGFLSSWLEVPVAEWQRRQVPREYRVLLDEQQDHQGHTVARLHSERRRPRLPDLLYGRREVDSAAWVCPRDGRLYQVLREGHRRASGRGPGRPPPVLRCCPDLEVTL